MNNIFVTKSSMPDFDDFCNEIKDMWDSHYLTNMGPKHNELCELLKKRFGVKYVDLFTNGHMALETALKALDLKGEVITTPYTFASTTHAIVRSGLKPVFCDIKKDDFTINEELIESLINENTCAIMPVHVYGNICNVKKIQSIADRYNLKVIYDAAHAFDETYKGKSVASFGDASCFSFHATKVFNTIEGGAAFYRNKACLDKRIKLKNFGYSDSDHIEEIGFNAKMNEFCAAMGICNLRSLSDNIQNRKQLSEKYIDLLSGVSGIKLNSYNSDTSYNYSYFPIVIEDGYEKTRDEIIDELAKNSIYARKYFYPLTSDFECYQGILNHGDTPVADYISERVLTLPLFPDLSFSDVECIVNTLLR